MFSKCLRVAVLLLPALLICAAPAHADTFYWNVASPGTGYVNEYNWADSGGGMLFSVPTTGDTVYVRNGGTATVSDGHTFGGVLTNLYLGQSGASNGNITQTGESVSTTGAIVIGGNGVATQSVYDLQGGSLTSGNAYTIIGDGASANGKLKISGGVAGTPTTFSTNIWLFAGWAGGSGVLEMSDYSSVLAGCGMHVGNGNGSNGTMLMTGNATLTSIGTPFYNWNSRAVIGAGAGAVGSWTMGDGVTAGATSATLNTMQMVVGDGSTASGGLTLHQDATMTANITGGYNVYTNTEGKTAIQTIAPEVTVGNYYGAGTVTLDGNASMTINNINNISVPATDTSNAFNMVGIVNLGRYAGSNGTLSMSGNSTMTINSNYFNVGNYGMSGAQAVGTINLSGGTDPFTRGAKLTVNGEAHFGIYDYGKGSLNVHDYAEFETAAGQTLILGDSYNAAAGEGSMLVDGHGKVTVGAWMNVGQLGYGHGTVTLKDYAELNVANDARIGIGFGNKGGTGELTTTNATNVQVAIGGGLLVGNNGNASQRAVGTMNISSGTTITAGWAIIGGEAFGNGAVNMTGGSITTNGLFAVARGSNCSGTLAMSGDALIRSTGGWVAAGNCYGGVTDGGAMGGTITMCDTATLSAAGDILVAWGGTGVLTIGDGTATDSAVATAGTGVLLGQGTSLQDTQGTINLNAGGTLETPNIYTSYGAGTPNFYTPSATVNFDGGLLKSTTSDSTYAFIDNTVIPVNEYGGRGGALAFTLNVMDGGARIDTDGHDNTITVALLAGEADDGGLIKLGDGTLTLAGGTNTYTGDTTVSGGTLSLASNTLLSDTASLWLAAGAALNLDFTGTAETVGGLYLNGVAQAAGTWGHSGSGATHIDDVFFSGTGTLLVGVPVAIPGDTDHDGDVDADDASKLATNWGQTGLTGGADVGDFNGDGNVNAADASILAANWTGSQEGHATVPEPSTFAFLAVLIGWLIARRRGH